MSVEVEYELTTNKGLRNERTYRYTAKRVFGRWWSRIGVFKDVTDFIDKIEAKHDVAPDTSFLRGPMDAQVSATMQDGSIVDFAMPGVTVSELADRVEEVDDERRGA